MLDIRLTPNAARDAIEGFHILADGRPVVSVRVRAVPEKGAANKALVKLLAKAFGTAKSNIRLVKGTTARVKVVEISGDGRALAETLEALLT